jgi:putative chitinase
MASIYKIFAPNSKAVITNGVHQWFNFYKEQFRVNTPVRIASFMAQASHETAQFQTLEEYASGANYEGRMDLGNIYKGDGVKFKGRGIFQITGRANYKTMSAKIFGDDRLLNNPSILLQPQYAVLSAFHFWNDRNLNALADKKATVSISKKINGGTNGLKERVANFAKISSLFAINPTFASLYFLPEKKKFSPKKMADNFITIASNFWDFFTFK